MIFGPLPGGKDQEIQNVCSGDAGGQGQVHGVQRDLVKGRVAQAALLQQKPEKGPEIEIIFVHRPGRAAENGLQIDQIIPEDGGRFLEMIHDSLLQGFWYDYTRYFSICKRKTNICLKFCVRNPGESEK